MDIGHDRSSGAVSVRPDPALLSAIIDDGTRRYFTARRKRIAPFIGEHFSWRGAWRLNRRAIGADILRSPVNAALAGPSLALKGIAALANRMGHRSAAQALRSRNLFLKTDVARELEWLIFRDLLELPFEQPTKSRITARDALAEAILADPRLDDVWRPILDAAARKITDPGLRQRLDESLATYASTRTATSELANLGFALGAGAIIAQQMTPGLLSLGSAIAQASAEKIALSTFPLGPAAGKIWFSVLPVPPALGASAALAAGAIATVIALTAVSGVVLDPLQAKLGLHRRRLDRLVSSLERTFMGDTAERHHVRDHYLARLLDLVDAGAAIWAAR